MDGPYGTFKKEKARLPQFYKNPTKWFSIQSPVDAMKKTYSNV